ncbi:MAG: response regulator [Acidobacteria bacterium]|nr:response regulator [Acidobacteriota bacterium]
MTLHLLIVEDDDDFVEELQRTVEDLPGEAEACVVGSRDDAYEALTSSFFDLVILDLKIPTVKGALDADPQHGYAVFNKIRTAAPGTPVLVLTGSPAEDFLVNHAMKSQQQVDIWSEGKKRGTIRFLTKYHFDQCPEMLGAVAKAIEGLASVEVEGTDVDLRVPEDRLVRIFAKRLRGVRCAVSELGSGLSGARVLRLRVTDRQGVLLHDAVGKLSTHEDVRREGACYDLDVIRLAPAATPRKLATLEYGAHSLAGVFFGLAEGADESVFEIARAFPGRAKEIVQSLEVAMRNWIEGVPETRSTIKNVRRRLLSDQLFDRVLETFGSDWVQDFERRKIQVRLGCSHGDLHGKNVLVSPSRTELIDYADVGEGVASLDAVTLELSLLFHPDGPGRHGTWPSGKQARAWGTLDVYLDQCPFPEFVRECRAWALRSAAGSREVAAAAYGYLVRQLTYEDTDKERALALLEGVRTFYEGCT